MKFASGRLLSLAILLSLVAGLFFVRLDGRDLWSSHERERPRMRSGYSMTVHGDCRGCLTINSIPKTTDVLLARRRCGLAQRRARQCAMAERLPAALSATVTVLLIFFVLKRRGRPVAGLVAGLMLATANISPCSLGRGESTCR